METAEDPLCALRREKALNVGDDQDQNPQQNHDFDHIVEKELDAAANSACRVQTAGLHQPADQPAQPFHAQDLILDQRPDASQTFHILHLSKIVRFEFINIYAGIKAVPADNQHDLSQHGRFSSPGTTVVRAVSSS